MSIEWIVILGGIVFYFWRKGRASPPAGNVSARTPDETRRAAIYYLAHLLGTLRYDDIGQQTIHYMLRSKTPRQFTSAIMGNLGTQQAFLGQIRLFAQFESTAYSSADLESILAEATKIFREQGAVVNLDPKVQQEIRQMEIRGADPEQIYEQKLYLIQENVLALFENAFNEGFWTYQKRMIARWNEVPPVIEQQRIPRLTS